MTIYQFHDKHKEEIRISTTLIRSLIKEKKEQLIKDEVVSLIKKPSQTKIDITDEDKFLRFLKGLMI